MSAGKRQEDDKLADNTYGEWTDEEEREFQAMMRAACKPSSEKQKKKDEAFVMVPIGWAERASKAVREPKFFVWLWLLHLAWKLHSKTFLLPNGALHAAGVSREMKRRALAELEQGGLIKVERCGNKNPTVTLLY
jgi:hypothetical protein